MQMFPFLLTFIVIHSPLQRLGTSDRVSDQYSSSERALGVDLPILLVCHSKKATMISRWTEASAEKSDRYQSGVNIDFKDLFPNVRKLFAWRILFTRAIEVSQKCDERLYFWLAFASLEIICSASYIDYIFHWKNACIPDFKYKLYLLAIVNVN